MRDAGDDVIMAKDKQQGRGELELALEHLYMIFGGNVVATLRVTGKGMYLLKVVNERYRSIDGDDDDEDIMPPPLKVGAGKLRDVRADYFG